QQVGGLLAAQDLRVAGFGGPTGHLRPFGRVLVDPGRSFFVWHWWVDLLRAFWGIASRGCTFTVNVHFFKERGKTMAGPTRKVFKRGARAPPRGKLAWAQAVHCAR